MEEVPPELWVEILGYVGPYDVLKNVSLVSSHWNNLANHPSLWHSFCERPEVIDKTVDVEDWKNRYRECKNITKRNFNSFSF